LADRKALVKLSNVANVESDLRQPADSDPSMCTTNTKMGLGGVCEDLRKKKHYEKRI